MILSSCIANFCAFALFLGALVMATILTQQVREVLKDREIKEFPFKKMLAITAISPVVLVLLLVGISISGSSSKTVNFAFSEVEIQKCQTNSISYEEDEGDEEGEEDVAFLNSNCEGTPRDNYFKFSGKYL